MKRAALFLVFAFGARLAFGLASELWSVDQIQIYLIGLKYYTTGVMPDFGPDVVYTQTQVPGSLLGLLVGGPLFLLAQPEAPYVFLNLLSLAALALLAWYIGKRMPDVPRWFLWPWIFFAPWTLNITTGIINTSYMMCGSIVFFVSMFELLPSLRREILPRPLAYFGAGFGLLWVAQLHLSYALLVPFAAVALLASLRFGARSVVMAVLCFAAGAALSGSTLVPTVLHHGVGAVAKGTGANMQFSPGNLLDIPLIVLRFLSFGTFELPRFIGAGAGQRLAFLATYWWAAPFAIFAGICGLIQLVILLAGLLRRGAYRRTILITLALICLTFVLSIKEPVSHTYYVMLPMVMLYAFDCYRPILLTRAGRTAAMALLICGAVTDIAIAVDSYSKTSLYVNRPIVVRAIVEKNHHLVGERRPDIW